MINLVLPSLQSTLQPVLGRGRSGSTKVAKAGQGDLFPCVSSLLGLYQHRIYLARSAACTKYMINAWPCNTLPVPAAYIATDVS